jgi:hypothetical protein
VYFSTLTKTIFCLDRGVHLILHLAASTLESEIEAALALLLEAEQGISLEKVKALVESQVRAEGPEMKPFEVDLSSYDALLPTSMEVAS